MSTHSQCAYGTSSVLEMSQRLQLFALQLLLPLYWLTEFRKTCKVNVYEPCEVVNVQ